MSCKDNINLKPAFISSFSNLYLYASKSANSNSNLYKPTSNIYSDSILTNNEGFSNISNNIDLINIYGTEEILENKDNFFIIDNRNNNIYENCVITSGVPWYNTNNKYNKCEIPSNIKLDDNNILKINDDKKTINFDFKSKKNEKAFCSHYWNVNKAYCENSWYDWLIIPNYYLGNTYYKDIGKYTDKDVYKCYKPCKGDYIPYVTDKKEMKCIPKELYLGGLLANKYKYSALGLINLIGNIAFNTMTYFEIDKRKNNILTFINYYLIFYYKHTKNIDDNIYKPNNIYDDIINIAGGQSDKNFNDFMINILDIEKEFIQCIKDEIINSENFDNSNNQNYEKLNIFSYKSLEFQEKTNDLLTINGLENNNILIDPILIHIWILANLFRPYSKTDLENIKTQTFQANTQKKYELFDCLNSYNFDNDKNRNINIAIRLKNIFFKAVNVCYDNKTNFSANIINKTKKALQNAELIDLIEKNNFYINQNYGSLIITTINENRKTIFSTNAGLKNFLKPESLDNFQEIKYYSDIELSELVSSITGKNEILKDIIGDFGMETKDNIIDGGENNRFKYLFSIEFLEKSNICKLNEVYDPVTGLCNPRPPKIDKSISNKNDEQNIDNLDDDFKLPQLKFFLTLFIQLLFVIIIGYIIYLFYNIFGETIIASINYLLEAIFEFYYLVRMAGFDKNDVKDIKKALDIQLNNELSKNANLSEKISRVSQYIKDNSEIK